MLARRPIAAVPEVRYRAHVPHCDCALPLIHARAKRVDRLDLSKS